MGTLQTKLVLRCEATDTEKLDNRVAVGESGQLYRSAE